MTDKRITELEQILTKRLQPSYIHIVDDSHLHVGHVGAEEGKLHITIEISSGKLNDMKRIEQHRLIYEQMKSVEHHFHAVSIKII
ncbi:MAG: BolA family transcriptional regulator [Legionellales bacterium]|nr:BolA family transcriptional regulator [Legionellales bacterium]|tara:strand:- start:552 stop:806 length:255 start_codon:yes stop_codon:yes gene_type:complete